MGSLVGGHYHDKIVSSSGQGKCTFDLKKSSHTRDFSQSTRRESASLTSSGYILGLVNLDISRI